MPKVKLPQRGRARALEQPKTVKRQGETGTAIANGSDKPEKKAAVPEGMLVPVTLLLAAESIVAKADKENPLKQGVLLQQKGAGVARIVGRDLYRVFVASFPLGPKPPSWLKAGLLLPRDELKSRVSMIAKGGSDVVLVTHTKGEPVAILSNADESMVFKLRISPVGDASQYDPKLDASSFMDLDDDGNAKARKEWTPVGFNSQHLRHCGDLAKILTAGIPKDDRDANGMIVRVFDSGELNAPKVFDFVGWPGAVLVILPALVVQKALPLQTAAILDSATRGTLAALRAHVTRNVEWAADATDEAKKAEFEAKAQGFRDRIAAVLGRVPEPPALGAPKAPVAEIAKPAAEPEGDEAGVAAEPEGDEAGVAAEPADAPAEPWLMTKAEKAAATKRRKKAANDAAKASATSVH
jgi:hypothetical protein